MPNCYCEVVLVCRALDWTGRSWLNGYSIRQLQSGLKGGWFSPDQATVVERVLSGEDTTSHTATSGRKEFVFTINLCRSPLAEGGVSPFYKSLVLRFLFFATRELEQLA
jgi:hypothetical protein